jgi:ParB family transcriptional regulator, chromosome partitioning protein
MSLKDITIKKKDMILVDPRIITELPEYNSRNMESPETQAHIRKMANAMKESGVANFPPVTVSQKDGVTYLYAGYCRRRAAMLAISEGAPIVGIWAVANTQSDQERILDLLTSNDGLPLTMLEKAEVVKRLLKFEWTVSMIAQKMGVTPKAISDILALGEAPEEVKELVQGGKVSATLALEVTKENPEAAATTLKGAVQVAENQGKTKATRKHIQSPAESRIKTVYEQPKLKPCPFCKAYLVEDIEAENHRHPGDTCYLAGATVDATEVELWNARD